MVQCPSCAASTSGNDSPSVKHLLHEGTTTFCLYTVADNGFSLSVSSLCCFISLIKPVNGYIGSMSARIVAQSTIKTEAAPQRINVYV